jgi:Lmo2446-like, N-terminal
MNIWHDTIDAPRTPRRVSPGQGVDIIVGTWPIGPGQSVWVTWARIAANGDATEGGAIAEWQRNSDVNSYWMARLPPFGEGDRVTYTSRSTRPSSANAQRRSHLDLSCA